MAKNNNIEVGVEKLTENLLEDGLLSLLQDKINGITEVQPERRLHAVLQWSEAIRAFLSDVDDEFTKSKMRSFTKVFAVMVLDLPPKVARELGVLIAEKEYSKFTKGLEKQDFPSAESRSTSIVATLIHIIFKYVEEV